MIIVEFINVCIFCRDTTPPFLPTDRQGVERPLQWKVTSIRSRRLGSHLKHSLNAERMKV